MTGKAYTGEVLIQVWQKCVKKRMSYVFDKQVNGQKEKNFRGSCKLPQADEKVCNENATNKKKQHAHKNVIDLRIGGIDFLHCWVTDSI